MTSMNCACIKEVAVTKIGKAFSDRVNVLFIYFFDHHLQLVPRSRKLGPIQPLSHTSSRRSALSVKHKDNFTFLVT
jgi:hypothetical protein